MIQPSGAGRIDDDLILPASPETQPGPRLESAAGFNALFAHRVRVLAGADIDPRAHRLAPARLPARRPLTRPTARPPAAAAGKAWPHRSRRVTLR